MKQLLVHVGYAKSGSTWLQKEFFPKIQGINYLGRVKSRKNLTAEHALRFCDRLCADDKFSLTLLEKFALNTRLKNAQLNLMSHENILRPANNEATFERLSDVLSNCQISILLLIRNQVDIIKSRYNHDKNLFNTTLGLNEVWERSTNKKCVFPYCQRVAKANCYCNEIGFKVIPPEYYDYNAIYKILSAQFGKDNVHVFPLEGILEVREMQKSLARLCGVGHNVDRFLSRISFEPMNKAEYTLSDRDAEAAIERYYSDSNRQLQFDTRMPLKDLGYPYRS